MLLGIKINFVNFIAFPITFGIGVDYAVNVMARYLRDGGRERRRRRARHRAAPSRSARSRRSSATRRCWSRKNVGLFLFGVLAVLGEITCLVTAVIVLPVRAAAGPPAIEPAAAAPSNGTRRPA